MKRYENPSYKGRIYPILYEEIASHYQTTVKNVEKDIRTILERTWTIESSDAQYKLYGEIISSSKGKPTAAKFIERTVEILVDKMK